jgi:hypothetical protein
MSVRAGSRSFEELLQSRNVAEDGSLVRLSDCNLSGFIVNRHCRHWEARFDAPILASF